jgi:hypothetical protein
VRERADAEDHYAGPGWIFFVQSLVAQAGAMEAQFAMLRP